MDVASWAQTHKPEAAIGVLGILLAVYAIRKQSGSGTSLFGTSTSALGTSTVDTTNSDLYAQLENQITSLQKPASAPSANGWNIPSGLIEEGSGFVIPGSAGMVESDSNGNTYTYIQTAAEASAAQMSGQALYFQPTPGHFTATKGKKLLKGTPQFVKLP